MGDGGAVCREPPGLEKVRYDRLLIYCQAFQIQIMALIYIFPAGAVYLGWPNGKF